MKPRSRLTLKEQRFVDAYLGVSKGNVTDAAFRAGYGSTRPSAETLGSRLLGKVGIQQAIYKRVTREQEASIQTAKERDELLSAIARKTTEETHNRIKAMQELNRVTGRHSLKHVVEGHMTLADIIAGSRRI